MTVPSNLVPTKITDLPVAPAPTASGTIPIVIGGVLYQAVFSDVAGSAEVPSSRIIAAGTGLTGGGNLTQDRVIAVANGGIGDTQLDNSGVVAGTYGSSTQIPVIQVNAKGRVIGVTLTAPSFAGLVPDSRQIIAGTGLSGGGDLQANRTLSINFSNATPQALGSASPGVGTQAARDDHVHPPVDLSDAAERTGILGIANGGTGENITNLVAGAVLFTDGTHLVLQTTQGTPGQALISNGASAPTWVTLPGTGTVTSVGLAMPSIFNVTGSPITIAGTLTASLANQNANVVFAGPTNGAAAAPTFRALVNADVPTTLTGKTISGSDNTLSNIGNASLTNSSLTIGTTNIALGATSFTLGGLTSIALTQDPTTALQVATKQYVDNVAEGLDVKASCIAATTGNITLSGAQTIDGVSVVAGNRVLVKNQSTAAENGIYIADNATWFRSSDANTWDELRSAFTFIEQGTTNGDTGWVCTIDAGGTLGVTAVTWSQFSGAGTYTAGTGLTLTGSVFSITNTAVTPASYGAADKTLTATVNAQGQLTALADTAIAIANTQVSGLGTMSTQDANNVAVTGGAIDGTTIGGVTPAAGTFTTATATTVNATTFDTNVAAAGVTLSGTTLAADGTDSDINVLINTKGTAGVGIDGAPTGTVAGVTVTSKFCVKGDGSQPIAGFVHANNTTAASPSIVYACRSRGTIASPAVVQDNDALASFIVAGFDGTDLALAARIDFEVDGTPGSNDMPTRMIFKTTPDGSQIPVEAMRISSGQIVTLANALPIASGGTNATATPTAGAIAYGTGTAYAFNSAGSATEVLTSAGASAPTWTAQSSLSVGSATTATNLAAGVAGAVPYQTGAGATGFSAAGNSGEFLVSGGTGAPTWTATISGGTFA